MNERYQVVNEKNNRIKIDIIMNIPDSANIKINWDFLIIYNQMNGWVYIIFSSKKKSVYQ